MGGMKKLLPALFLLALPLLAVAADKPSVRELVRSTESWNGSPLPQLFEGETEVTILQITIPPKSRLPLHKHPLINAGILLSGELTVRTEGDDVKHLKAGDALIELVNEWHYGENAGDQPAVIAVVYVGEKGTPLSIAKPEKPKAGACCAPAPGK